MDRREFDLVFHGDDPQLRFAVESPVRYEVWLAYATAVQPDERQDLIVHVRSSDRPENVARLLRDKFAGDLAAIAAAEIAVTGDFLAVRLTFAEMVRVLLPLTDLGPVLAHAAQLAKRFPDRFLEAKYGIGTQLVGPEAFAEFVPSAMEGQRGQQRRDHLWWLLNVLAAVAHRSFSINVLHAIRTLRTLLDGLDEGWPDAPGLFTSAGDDPPVEQVTLNRRAGIAVARSRSTIKADAASRVFDVSCRDLVWAVLDSGIDALHPAFRVRDDTAPPGQWDSRVVATYDFTHVRQALSRADGMTGNLLPSGTIDWEPILPSLQVQHTIQGYLPPDSPHGTHVAGVLAADWPDQALTGICPDLRLIDIRVLDANGRGDEFSIVAALQFVRWLNERQRALHVAGVNLSLSIPHDVANYSCGWTPICVECDRLVRAGVVVVAAAGNSGIEGGASATFADGTSYRTVSITDPGNADRVITVGSTHAVDPHRHGVSYFSGKGPTADGRMKPDLLAPGERIDAPIPRGELRRMDGTSQAAPHVSGAAALLLARYRELRGQPDRVKDILCATATDLKRERSFQGHGLVDVLRAMQAL